MYLYSATLACVLFWVFYRQFGTLMYHLLVQYSIVKSKMKDSKLLKKSPAVEIMDAYILSFTEGAVERIDCANDFLMNDTHSAFSSSEFYCDGHEEDVMVVHYEDDDKREFVWIASTAEQVTFPGSKFLKFVKQNEYLQKHAKEGSEEQQTTIKPFSGVVSASLTYENEDTGEEVTVPCREELTKLLGPDYFKHPVAAKKDIIRVAWYLLSKEGQDDQVPDYDKCTLCELNYSFIAKDGSFINCHDLPTSEDFSIRSRVNSWEDLGKKLCIASQTQEKPADT